MISRLFKSHCPFKIISVNVLSGSSREPSPKLNEGHPTLGIRRQSTTDEIFIARYFRDVDIIQYGFIDSTYFIAFFLRF